MEKKDIDLYLDRVNAESSKKEKLSATSDFLKLINESIVFRDDSRFLHTTKSIDKNLIDYMVETGALSIFHKIGAPEIVDLTRIVGFLIDNSNAPNKDEEAKKIEEDVETFLKDPNMLGENPTQEQIDIYDGLLTKYLYTAIETEKLVGEIGKEATTRLFSSLPEGKKHWQTMAYKLQISRKMQDREDLVNLIPKLPIEEYRESLENPQVNAAGEIVNLRDYDNLMNEYLFHYGQTGEISINEKSKLFKSLLDNVRPGRLISSNAYTKYFSVSGLEDDQRVTFGQNFAIIRDVLARIYENNGKDTRITDFEKIIINDFYLPSEYNWEIENPEKFAEMKANNPDINPITPIVGRLEDNVKNLFSSAPSDTIETARYMIRLQNLFKVRNRPNEESLAKIYDFVKNFKFIDALKENLEPEKLKERDPNIKMDYEEMLQFLGIEETEEQRQIRLENEKMLEEAGDPNLSTEGLRRIDYADIALELILESDFNRGVAEFAKPETKKAFKEAGRNIYDSRAIRKMVELYVEDPKKYDMCYSAEKEITQYVMSAVSKPDFNIFKEQGIAELMQLGNLKKSNFANRMVDLANQALAKNPNYAMTPQEAASTVKEFIKSTGDNVIDSSREAEFDKFLTALTKVRFALPTGIMPEKAIDFLMNQSMRADSLINTNRDKYGKVPERALEDLGKMDNLRRNNGKPLSYLYIIRDYIKKDLTMGLHLGEVVTVKRERINLLEQGDPDVIETLFHENTHMNQNVRLDERVANYKDYIMLKEAFIRKDELYKGDDNYYEENYAMIFKEIEAREIGTRMTSEYLGKIAPKSRMTDMADSLKNDVVEMLVDKFKQEQMKLSERSKKESTSYVDALQKKDKDGTTRSVNQIFDKRFSGTSVMTKFIEGTRNLALLEYDYNGRRRTFPEQIRCVSSIASPNTNYAFVNDIIKYSGTAENANSKEAVLALETLVKSSHDDNTKAFVGNIVAQNYLPILRSFVKDTIEPLKENPKLTVDMVDTYTTVSSLVNTVKSEPNAPWTKGFKVQNDKGNDAFALLDRYQSIMKGLYPKIDIVALKLQEEREKKAKEIKPVPTISSSKSKKGFFSKVFGYKDMAQVDADIEGKRAVENYENKLIAQEKIDEQEINQ